MALLDAINQQQAALRREYRAILDRELAGKPKAKDGERLLELANILGFDQERVGQHLEALMEYARRAAMEPLASDAKRIHAEYLASEREREALQKQWVEVARDWQLKQKAAAERCLRAHTRELQADGHRRNLAKIEAEFPELFGADDQP